MRRNTARGTMLGLGLLVMPALAMAGDPVLMQRCTNDSLDNTQATNRLAWARKCSLKKLFTGPTAFGDLAAPDYMNPLYDYVEADAYSFAGDGWGREINSTAVNLQYLGGGTYQGPDESGFYKWWRPASRLKTRVFYPIFGTIDDVYNPGNHQLYPHPSLTDCNLYSTPYGTGAVSSFYVNGYCEASCYTPEQTVLFSKGEVPIAQAVEQLRSDLITLSEESTLENIQLKETPTYSYTRETHEAEHKVVEITTSSGGFLRVTDEHPVIQGEGRIVQARTLKEGDMLVKADGTQEPITRINKTTYKGRVYNLRPTSENRVSNILVAQGFLVGSSVFQNDELDFINRIVLYSSPVPGGVIP